jgi:uncharacterized protein YjiS (DUF1127 family)
MIVDRISSDFRRWRAYRKTMTELSKLTARQLEDVGIAPYEIEDAARGRYRR